jgi:ABC-type lipoprotein export system ATPase subunit
LIYIGIPTYDGKIHHSTVAGLVQTARFCGEKHVSVGMEVIPHDAFIGRARNLIDHLTVLENVLLGISLRGPERRRNRALEALRKTGLAEFADRRGGLLSPGEQQRAAVARVWAAAPDVILADEPTSSLDGPGAERVMDALWEASEGRTMIVVSHDPRLRARFADMRDFGEMIA